MKYKAKQFLNHPLVYGSSIVILGNLFANFFNFLFNLFMSRNLSVAEYGVLASVIAFIGFPNLAVGAVIPLIVHFAGNYFATGKLAMIRGLYLQMIKFLLLIGLVISFLFLIFIPQFSAFFHINDIGILLLTDFMIFITFISVINVAFLQAKLAFFFQVFMSIFGALVKFSLGAVLVLSGFAVGGAVFALFVSFLVTYLISFLPLKFIFDTKIVSPKVEMKELFSYGIPSALTLVGLTSFISSDIVLVKHFFNPTSAGMYAGLALIGKVIFYLSAPIGSVMFPLIVQKHSKNENFTNTFKLSLFFVLLPSVLLTIFYYFFPEFTILFFLKKKEYLTVRPLLWLFGTFMSLYGVLTIISNFYLSIKKTKIFIPIMIGAFLQIIFIFLYHQTFLQIVTISSIITFLLVCSLLLYYPYATKK